LQEYAAYYSDHLGSAQLITDYKGDEYERLEYTPYGELWIEKASAASALDVAYRFTGKERDKETGLYYYGARYLNPRDSRWLSVDPALGEYVPEAPVDDEARKRNGNLPSMREVVFDSNGNAVKSLSDKGTSNYDLSGLGHLLYDMLPYFEQMGKTGKIINTRYHFNKSKSGQNTNSSYW
jgi:RHS repeat-associated protein